jgi:hypothetical protein
MTTKQNGGEVINSGGFGCIFKPELKCSNNDSEIASGNETNRISKLMTNKNAIEEFNLIQKFKSILNTIPNYENYFLLNNFTLCKPNKLTKDDLKKYNKKCKALKKKNITAKNINKSLDKILSLNMPDGGIDIEDFIEKDKYFIKTNFINLNTSLIDLLKNGIIPMNKLNVFHCDIKDSNVLVQTINNSFNTRLIDWGLSIIYNSNKEFPRKLYRRPFQYNVPFSSILFNKEFINRYHNFITLYPTPHYFQIREFVINYIFFWNNIRGSGHLDAINKIVKIFTISELTSIKKKKIRNHVIEYDFTYYYIVEYISKILYKYTNNGELELVKYFNMIFLKNIDIWGFTMIYISIVEHLYNSFKNLTDYHLQIINKIKYIIIHFLYENPLHPINIDSLVNELTKLNDIMNLTNRDTNDITKTDTNDITKTDTNDITKTDTNTKYFEKKGGKSYKLVKKSNKSYENNKTRRRIMK